MLTAADFFFVDQLPAYDPAELIPQKGDAALALSVLTPSTLWPATSSITTRWIRRCERLRSAGGEGRTDVSAHPRSGVRAQECAAAV